MRKICVVTNYNYDKYLSFCLDSLVRQSVKFDIIYVVDDGSSDSSKSIVKEYAETFREIKPLYKENGGQLSCFNFVSDYINEDDLVWCMDSDDYYPPDYVEHFLLETRDSKSDFFYCKRVKFSLDKDAPKTSYLEKTPKIDIKSSSQITRLTKVWIGNATSSLVVTGRLFKDIFPFPFESEWKTRADDVLIFASSLGSYAKTFLPSLCIGYRIHEENNYYGAVLNQRYEKNRTTSLNRLFLWYQKKYSLTNKIEFAIALKEYQSIPSLSSYLSKSGNIIVGVFGDSIYRVARTLQKYLVYRWNITTYFLIKNFNKDDNK